MERAEDIKQILLDEDILRRVKEWIYSRDEMNQASVAAATDSNLSLMEVLKQLPIDEFEKMKQDLNLDFEGLRSKSPAAMDGGFSPGPKGGLDSHEVPPELNEQGIRNEVQEPHDHMSHIPSETLHTIVSMLERELKRRDQPARCNTCANFESENKNLRKSNRSLGLQFEQLQWNYIKVQQDIKTLEENLIQKDQDIEENKRVIRYFHMIMVDRKKKIDKLKKEMDILRNKHKEELCQKLDKVVVKELEEKAQQKKQMKKQTEMMEEAYVKKVGTESELRKLNEKTNVLLKENESLKEENRWLKEKLDTSNREINEGRQNDKTNVLLRENELLKGENRQLKEELDASNAEVNGLRLRLQAQEEKIKEGEEIDAIQEEFALREAQLKDRIDNEIQKLMQVYEDLKMYAVRHGLSLNLETKRECSDFPSP